MYVKIFAQILDSSIADDHLTRWVFEDFLKLADKDGLVDMTLAAIARRTNVPLQIVTRGIEKLTEPDPTSRSLEEEGRRIVLIDPQRPWGWRIVNYAHYRNIRDGEDRKAYFRERKAEQRARLKAVQDKQGQSEKSKDGTENVTSVTQAEAEARVQMHKGRGAHSKRAPSPRPKPSSESEVAAVRVLQGLELSAGFSEIDRVRQQIEFEAPKHGGIDGAATFILECTKFAKTESPSERITAFWIGDGKYRDWNPKHFWWRKAANPE